MNTTPRTVAAAVAALIMTAGTLTACGETAPEPGAGTQQMLQEGPGANPSAHHPTILRKRFL